MFTSLSSSGHQVIAALQRRRSAKQEAHQKRKSASSMSTSTRSLGASISSWPSLSTPGRTVLDSLHLECSTASSHLGRRGGTRPSTDNALKSRGARRSRMPKRNELRTSLAETMSMLLESNEALGVDIQLSRIWGQTTRVCCRIYGQASSRERLTVPMQPLAGIYRREEQ